MMRFAFQRIIIGMITFLSLAGCNNQKGVETIACIDLDNGGKYDVHNFVNHLQIKLVPLESSQDAYFNGGLCTLIRHGDYLFVSDPLQNIMLVFDIKGKFIRKINRQGNGPQEYNSISNIAVSDNRLFVHDRAKIQIYDYQGEYINTVHLEQTGYQIAISPVGKIVVYGNYNNANKLILYDQNGEVIHRYGQNNPEFANSFFNRASSCSLGFINEQLYFTDYFNYNVYVLNNGNIDTLIRFDFGRYNLPADFCDNGDLLFPRFSKERDKYILSVDYLTITDKWIIFCPDIFNKDKLMFVFYNRTDRNYLSSKQLPPVYDALLGISGRPCGYNKETKEVCGLVSGLKIKNLIENEPMFTKLYPFLDDIDFDSINEDSNELVYFVKID